MISFVERGNNPNVGGGDSPYTKGGTSPPSRGSQFYRGRASPFRPRLSGSNPPGRDVLEGLVQTPLKVIHRGGTPSMPEIKMKDVQYLASYNWVEDKQPTMIVPGLYYDCPGYSRLMGHTYQVRRGSGLLEQCRSPYSRTAEIRLSIRMDIGCPPALCSPYSVLSTSWRAREMGEISTGPQWILSLIEIICESS